MWYNKDNPRENKIHKRELIKMIKIYIKATPISDWQFIGEVATWEHANKVEAKAAAKGYYFKAVE